MCVLGEIELEGGRAEVGGKVGLGRALAADDQFGGRVQGQQVRGDQRQRAVADDRDALPWPRAAA